MACLSTAESYSYGVLVYSYACIYQLNVEDFVVENPHGRFTSFLNAFFDIAVIRVSRYFQNLKNQNFFLWTLYSVYIILC